MDANSLDEHLSRIPTLWTVVCRANEGGQPDALAAQKQMLDRYGGAIRRYLRAALRDADAADELFQEFAIRFLHGKLKGATPERGRFRDFVKGVLFHLIADYRKKQYRLPKGLPADHPDLAVEPGSTTGAEREFLASWRDELLSRAWEALKEHGEASGQNFYAILRFRAENPAMPSRRMAEELSAQLGKNLSAAGVRQTMHRAREKFADLLLDEIVQSLENPRPEQVEQELINLGLLEYCRPALERREPRSD
jgi:RNA polymerase sigma-70 factor (ECF subfamily)